MGGAPPAGTRGAQEGMTDASPDSPDELLELDEIPPDEDQLIQRIEGMVRDFDPARENAALYGELRALTAHDSPRVRYHARRILSDLQKLAPALGPHVPTTREETEAQLSSNDPDVRLGAVLGARKLVDPELLPPLLEKLRTERDSWVRASLVKAVADYRNRMVLPLLVKCLEDPDGRVRANTVEALAGWENPVVESRIAQMVDDPEHRVQAAVLTFLGRGGHSIRERIEKMLASGYVWLQSTAVYVMGNLKPPWAVEILTEFQKKGIRDRRLRERVVNWIGVLGRTSTMGPDEPQIPQIPDETDPEETVHQAPSPSDTVIR